MKKCFSQSIAVFSAFLMLSLAWGGILTSCDRIDDVQETIVPGDGDEGKDDEGEEPDPPVIAGYDEIVFTVNIAGELFLGEEPVTATVIAEIPEGKEAPEITYQWTAEPADVVSISGSGQTVSLAPLKEGECVLTVSCTEDSGLKGTKEISVTDPDNPYPALVLSLSPESIQKLQAGETADVTATVTGYPSRVDINKKPVTLKWESSNTEVFTVGSGTTSFDGTNPMTVKLTAVAAGDAVLTVSCVEAPGLSRTVAVNVIPARGPEYNRIFVDFGHNLPTAQNGRQGWFSNDPWNNIDAYKSFPLNDEKGNETSIALDLTGWKWSLSDATPKFDSYYSYGTFTNLPSDIANMAKTMVQFNEIDFPLTAVRDQLFVYNHESETFVIKGLNPDIEYEFTTMSIRMNSDKTVREMKLKFDGEQSYSETIKQGLKQGELPNMFPTWEEIAWADYCKIFKLKPKSDGTITVTLIAEKKEKAWEAHLSALVITPIYPY